MWSRGLTTHCTGHTHAHKPWEKKLCLADSFRWPCHWQWWCGADLCRPEQTLLVPGQHSHEENTTGLVPSCSSSSLYAAWLGKLWEIVLLAVTVCHEWVQHLTYNTPTNDTPTNIISLPNNHPLLLLVSLEFCLVNQALSSLHRLATNKKKWMTLSLSGRHSSSFRENIKYLCLLKSFYSRAGICISARRELSRWSWYNVTI